MVTAQQASESTPIPKIAARGDSRSVPGIAGVGAASEVEISGYGSVDIVRSLFWQPLKYAAGPDARAGRQ